MEEERELLFPRCLLLWGTRCCWGAGCTGRGQARRGSPLAPLMAGALAGAWPGAAWTAQPPAETAGGGDWKQAFLSGHVGLEAAKCPALPAGSRRRMHPWEESPLIFPRRVGGIQPWEEMARVCSLASYGIRRGSTDNHPPGISAFLTGEYPPRDSHDVN